LQVGELADGLWQLCQPIAVEDKILQAGELANDLRQLCQQTAAEDKLLQVGELADLNRKFRESPAIYVESFPPLAGGLFDDPERLFIVCEFMPSFR
jgi:hypothetical protein